MGSIRRYAILGQYIYNSSYLSKFRGMYFGLYDTLKPLLLGADAGVATSFLLGWAVTITSGLMSYPIGKLM